MKCHKTDLESDNHSRGGRPPSLSVYEKREIAKIIKKEPKTPSIELSVLEETSGTVVYPGICRKKP